MWIRYIWAKFSKVPNGKNRPFFLSAHCFTVSLTISLIPALCLSVCLTLYPPPPSFNKLQHVNLYGIGMRTDVCSRAKERIRKVENKVTAVSQMTETGGRRGA